MIDPENTRRIRKDLILTSWERGLSTVWGGAEKDGFIVFSSQKDMTGFLYDHFCLYAKYNRIEDGMPSRPPRTQDSTYKTKGKENMFPLPRSGTLSRPVEWVVNSNRPHLESILSLAESRMEMLDDKDPNAAFFKAIIHLAKLGLE